MRPSAAPQPGDPLAPPAGTAPTASTPATDNSVHGITLGTVLQAGTISGDVHVHAPPGHHDNRYGPRVPNQLRAATPIFTDRIDHRRVLDEALAAPRPPGACAVMLLVGLGGSGKSELALRWLHDNASQFPDGLLQVDLGATAPGAPRTVSEAMGGLVRALGVPPGAVPVDPDELAGLYRTVTSGRRLAVLVDDAADTDRLPDLLPASAHALVVITSRRPLPRLVTHSTAYLPLAPLAEADALGLVEQLAGPARVRADPSAAVELVRRCGGIPLAVVLAASLLAQHPQLSIADLLVDLTETGHDSETVFTMIDLAYEGLPARAAVLHRRLGSHPGSEWELGVAAAALGTTIAHVRPLVRHLVGAGLLTDLGEQRYRVDPSISYHARAVAEQSDSGQKRGAARGRILEYYRRRLLAADLAVTPHRRRLVFTASCEVDSVGFEDSTSALAWLERERATLITVARTAHAHGLHQLAWHVCDGLWPLFLKLKYYSDRLVVDELGVDAARAWDEPFAIADMLKRLGSVHSTLGNHPAAESLLNESLRWWARLDDTRGITDVVEAQALLALRRGKHDEAIVLFTKALNNYLALGADRNVGLTLLNLATTLTRDRQATEAISLLDHATQVFDGLTPPDRYNAGRVAIALGRAHSADNNPMRAEQHLLDAIEVMRREGSASEEADAVDALGDLRVQTDRTSEAKTCYEEALQLYELVHSPAAQRVRAKVTDWESDAGSE